MKKGFTALALLSLLLLGCAGSTYKVDQFQQNPKVKRSAMKGKRVFVAPLLLEATSVGNTSPSVDSGKQATHIVKDSLAKVYGSGLNERFQKRFSIITVVPQPDYARFNSVLTPDKLEETFHLSPRPLRSESSTIRPASAATNSD